MSAETIKQPPKRRSWRRWTVGIVLIVGSGLGLFLLRGSSYFTEIDDMKKEIAHLRREVQQNLATQVTPPNLTAIEARLEALEKRPSFSSLPSASSLPGVETLMLFHIFEWALTSGLDVKELADQLAVRVPESKSLLETLKTSATAPSLPTLLKPLQNFLSIQPLTQGPDHTEALRQLRALVFEHIMKERK